MRPSENGSIARGRIASAALFAAILGLSGCNSTAPGGGPPTFPSAVTQPPTVAASTTPAVMSPAVPTAAPVAATQVASLPPGPGLPDRARLLTPGPAAPTPSREMTGREIAIAALPDYCPLVEIRQGGAAYIVYERGGDGDPSRVRYQATINQFPRNCVDEAGTLTINLGVAGLLLTGPSGAPGSVTVPVHIEVVQDTDTVVFDRVYPTVATIAPGQLRVEFTRVEQIVVPSPPRENMRIYVSLTE